MIPPGFSSPIIFHCVYSVMFLTDAGEPVEIAALRTNITSISNVVTVGGNLQWFANCLVEKAFITRENAQGILGRCGLTPTQQASQLMDSVFAKIRGKRHWFDAFVNIFSHDAAHADLMQRLRMAGKLTAVRYISCSLAFVSLPSTCTVS